MKLSRILVAVVLFALSTRAGLSAPHEIYPDPAQAQADLKAALVRAAAEHKRVIVDFGGNWCGDCIVLDSYFHEARNRAILDAGFVLVHVNIGHMDANLGLAERFQVPLNRGVPALAVLSENGTLLYSQKNGEFEAMRSMEIGSVTAFLVKWTPSGEPCAKVVVNC
jgi:thiol:disulfide interchange protein